VPLFFVALFSPPTPCTPKTHERRGPPQPSCGHSTPLPTAWMEPAPFLRTRLSPLPDFHHSQRRVQQHFRAELHRRSYTTSTNRRLPCKDRRRLPFSFSIPPAYKLPPLRRSHRVHRSRPSLSFSPLVGPVHAAFFLFWGCLGPAEE